MKKDIILFENENIKLEVNMKEETVWLSQSQMSDLFGKSKSTINEHIKNIYREEELLESETMRKFGNSEFSDKPTNYYNLDMIISVGYRVKSKNGIIFRKWATKVLKDYMIKGYAVNQKRLETLEKTVKLIDIANRMDDRLMDKDAKEILKVIGEYSKAFELLDDYDHRRIKRETNRNSEIKISYNELIDIIKELKYNEKSKLFALERNNGLESILSNIYMTYDGKDLYNSLAEKAANFLYLLVKNHVFIDGNKRIAATLFIYFLSFYNMLYKDNEKVIDNNTLVALTLLIAESNPKEKEILIDLIINFLG